MIQAIRLWRTWTKVKAQQLLIISRHKAVVLSGHVGMLPWCVYCVQGAIRKTSYISMSKLKAAKKRSQPKNEWTTRETGEGGEGGCCICNVRGAYRLWWWWSWSWMYYDNVTLRRGQHFIFTYGFFLLMWLIFLSCRIMIDLVDAAFVYGHSHMALILKSFYSFWKIYIIFFFSSSSSNLINVWMFQDSEVMKSYFMSSVDFLKLFSWRRGGKSEGSSLCHWTPNHVAITIFFNLRGFCFIFSCVQFFFVYL